MNYANLSDVEFEYLCKDVMSRKLSKKLERFGPGRDGGIDLSDTSHPREIIVQVKHYVRTDFSGLIRSLEKEVPKVKEQAPKHYYVCCSKELSPQNKTQIYELFSSFMDSTEDVITTLELDEFLEAPENSDILRKHYKLWLDSTNILTDVLANDIFVDSEALMSGIEDEVKLFVKTQAFDEAIAYLEKRNVLIIVGNPGVGKTVTSKMLVLYYAAQGYRVRYTSDGSDLKALKRSLSQSTKSKEVILLDDCFGQAYFNMKETQENELLALIKYVNINPNKLLIMNSRISIYHEAKDRTPDLVKSFDRREYRAYILDMECMSIEEKAKIFYNHLYFYGVPDKYFQSIRADKNYRKIVKHSNYNPRIIEFICTPRQFKAIEPAKFASFVMSCLDKPERIWRNEYERRLAEVDRLFLTTIYSLSDTPVPFDMVKQCFEYRISQNPLLDPSVNHFDQTLNRLTNSMVKIVDSKGGKMLSAANPSVNDFLRAHLSINVPEERSLIADSNSVRQLKRLLDVGAYETRISNLFADYSILSFVFEDELQKSGFITAWCAKHQIYDTVYCPYISDYLFNIRDINMYESERASMVSILEGLFQEEFCTFYGLSKVICDISRFHEIFENLQLDEIVEVINHIDWMVDGSGRKLYVSMVQGILRESIETYCHDVPADNYDGSISDIVEEFCYDDETGGHIDADAAVSFLEDKIKDTVLDDLLAILSTLPTDINPDNVLYSEASISVDGAETVILNYLHDDYDDDAYHAYREEQFMDDHILDYMFNR